ncbi:hypothetical protein Y032_0048g1572 [Ancylostoma ceylanicum]|uniref:Uncharacterized protein n=1 Tax=Ancylostoma ceylanicum TaxID=53326 RepID=A0A016U9R0_9BILA|nr:hypothetical protein Y032_0048g1572 [Ancylostoma ceylanicum]
MPKFEEVYDCATAGKDAYDIIDCANPSYNSKVGLAVSTYTTRNLNLPEEDVLKEVANFTVQSVSVVLLCQILIESFVLLFALPIPDSGRLLDKLQPRPYSVDD